MPASGPLFDLFIRLCAINPAMTRPSSAVPLTAGRRALGSHPSGVDDSNGCAPS